MANDSIIFLCTACSTKLTVPWEMAGVVGPCPICEAEIQAPYPISEPAKVPVAGDSDPSPAEKTTITPVAETAGGAETVTELREVTAAATQIEPDFGFEEEVFGEIDDAPEIDTAVEIEVEHAVEEIEEFVPVAVVEERIPLVKAAEVEFFGEIDDEPVVETNLAPASVEERIKLPTEADIFEQPLADLVTQVPLGTEVEPVLTGEVEPRVDDVLTALESRSVTFPKTPPPYPLGLESPGSAIPALTIHPSLAKPQISLPPLEKITAAEPLPDPPLDVFAKKDGVPAIAPDEAAKDIDLPPPPIASGKIAKNVVTRSPTRSLPENMRQIPTKRGPTTAYPEPRRTLAVPSQSDLEADPTGPSDPFDETGISAKKGAKRRSHRQSRATKVLILAIFFVLLVATIAVLWTLKERQASESLRQNLKSKQLAQAGQTAPPSQPAPIPEPTVPILVKPKVEPPKSEPPAFAPPVERELSTPARAAMMVLEKFFRAQTLAERMPLIETKTPEGELMISSIASALPKLGRVSIEIVENNAAKQVIDYFYHVQFENLTMGMPSVTVLVRTRGAGPPKVVVDPFLDSFGGRLAAYASKPSDQVATFQVIIWPLPACYDTKIPNRIDKLTFKFLAKDDTKEIVLAYFGKQSQIAKMLEDDSHRLSYGKAQIATVNLGWNTKESQVAPFLEVLEIKTLDWDP